MPPRFLRGRDKGPVTGHDHEAGPSHRRTPSITMSTSPQEPWRLYVEPGRRSVSLSSSHSYQHSFGPQSENEPNNQPPSFIPLQRSNSHHSVGDPTPAFQSRFNPANYLPEPIGNNQTGEGFWKSVLAKFLKLMEQGPYRDLDSVSSKWRKMNGSVNKFSEEYNKIYTSGHRSGMSDEDVFKKALENYKTNHKITFAHVRAWEVMRTAPKWVPVPNEVEMAKQEYAVREAERPPGLDKSKREAASKKEKQKVSDSKMKEFMTQFKTYTEVAAQKAKAKERAVEEKARVAGEKLRLADDKVRLKEWDILTMDIDNYPEPKRSTLKKLQEDIMKKHQSR
ncbi:uncharacterized protein LOC110920084 [Helianthus annuus]|uniref:uncharacterized protein LOC110920084 n=1 Tax=Helianthus annuus TaxID=4232 RepID=UPI000B8FF7C2|nr:uncharacterized protein LOC110920084 [Helianthus annuus]